MQPTYFLLRGGRKTLGKTYRPWGRLGLSKTVLSENDLSASQRNELAKECSRIPPAVARAYQGSAAYEEALSAAGEGVWRACCFWTPELCPNVQTYATQWAAGMATTAVRKWRAGGLKGGPTNGLDFRPVRLGFDPDGRNIEDGMAGAPGPDPLAADLLARLLARLRRSFPRLADVVEAHDLKHWTHARIGRDVLGGKTRQAAQQAYAEGLGVLREWAGKMGGVHV